MKRAEAVPPGKKLKCPKCSVVFSPQALPETAGGPPPVPRQEVETIGLAVDPPKQVEPPKPAKPAPKPVVYEDEDGPIGLAMDTDNDVRIKAAAQDKQDKADEEDEDGKGQYGVTVDKSEAAEEVHFGSLRDKFAKSKIGPAMYLTVSASNWLLRLGIFSCICAIAKAFYDIFPVIFCEMAIPIRPFLRPQVTLMLFDFLVFCLGGVMCAGASRLHDLQSFPMALIGSIMAIVIYMPLCIIAAGYFLMVCGPRGLMMASAIGLISFVGVWCIIVMMKPAVRAGFQERVDQAAGKT